MTITQAMTGHQIETEIVYDDAVDVLPCRYTYEETDEPVEELEDGI